LKEKKNHSLYFYGALEKKKKNMVRKIKIILRYYWRYHLSFKKILKHTTNLGFKQNTQFPIPSLCSELRPTWLMWLAFTPFPFSLFFLSLHFGFSNYVTQPWRHFSGAPPPPAPPCLAGKFASSVRRAPPRSATATHLGGRESSSAWRSRHAPRSTAAHGRDRD